jgi:hypothetical protein
MHRDDIVRKALSDLQGSSIQGLDIVELRAVFAALPPVMTNDDAKGSKAAWLRGVQGAVEAMTRLEASGSLAPSKARHPCYAALAAGLGPFDPAVRLQAELVVKSSAFEPTKLGQGSGGGGGVDGDGASSGRVGHVAAMRAAILADGKGVGGGAAKKQEAGTSLDASGVAAARSSSKGAAAGVASLRGRVTSAAGKVGEEGEGGSSRGGGGGEGVGALMAEIAAAAARREAKEEAEVQGVEEP